MKKCDIAIVGGGIVGLATAYQIIRRHPRLCIFLLEKEKEIASHQTGHNSGVIHSGLYYTPGSIKAKNCAAGRKELIEFAREHRIPYNICGKILVATDESELAHLDTIEKIGFENGLQGLERIGPDEIRNREPHSRGIAGLWVPQTGIIDFTKVSHVLAEEILRRGSTRGCELLLHRRVTGIGRENGNMILKTNQESVAARILIGCAGLQSDRIARMDGIRADLRIVPFRGDYYELTPSAKSKIRHLIYPVPNPALPFLGVHFTRMINDTVECGPSAVFCFKREGYSKSDFRLRDTWESLSFLGTWKLFMHHWRYGLGEYSRALSKRLFLRALKRLVPDLEAQDIRPSRSGIRAQALNKRGELLDDFRIEATDHSIHVLNAPSPAATAALAIGRTVQEMATERFSLE